MYCKMTMKKILAILSLLVMLVVSMPVASADTTMDLEIPQGTSWGTWQKVSTRRMSFKFEVKNTSSYKTVRSFDVTYYTCDAYGNQNSPTQTVTLRHEAHTRALSAEGAMAAAEYLCAQGPGL